MIGRRLLIALNGIEGSIMNVRKLSLGAFGLGKMVRQFESDAVLDVRVIAWNEQEGVLLSEIIRYIPEKFPNMEVPESLNTILQKVVEVKFKNIDTLKLMKLAAGNRESKLTVPSVFRDNFISELFEPYLIQEEEETSEDSPEISTHIPVERILPLKYHKQKLSIAIKDLRFIFGGVAFDFYFKPKGCMIEVKIYNDIIREEFDAVKNYFRKLLNTKHIQVFLEIEHKGDEILNIEALSPEISRICAEDIEQIKFEFVQEVRKTKFFGETDKSMFTPEEMYEYFDDFGRKSKGFFEDASQLFDHLLGIKNAKHYKHLGYLSSLHAHDVMKLRFVITPLSFIFLVKGKIRYHFIWETLDSEEATWIWHSGSTREELRRTLANIEDILNVVKVQGKIAYINSNEDMFRRIIHDYSDLIEGFVKWKYELDRILV